MSTDLLHLETAPDLVDQAYRALVQAIAAGTLAPGARITQEDLAARLAVSRQPVLQALRLLKKDGLVHDAPGRGLQVAPLDAETIVRTYQVRGALDALAARLAAHQRFVVPPALLRAGREAAAGNDVGAMIETDIAFHQALYEASGNPFIAASTAVHWCHVRRAMGATLQASARRRPVWDEHETIAAAVAAGDAERAAQAATAHGQSAGAHLSGQLAGQHDDPAGPPTGANEPGRREGAPA